MTVGSTGQGNCTPDCRGPLRQHPKTCWRWWWPGEIRLGSKQCQNAQKAIAFKLKIPQLFHTVVLHKFLKVAKIHFIDANKFFEKVDKYSLIG